MARKNKNENVTSSEENLDLFKFLAINNGLEYLKDIPGYPNGIKSIRFGYRFSEKDTNVYLNDDFIDFIMTDSRVSEETYQYLISSTSESDKSIWKEGFPYLIHSAYKNNKRERFNELISIAWESDKTGVGVPIQKRTIDLALDHQENELAKHLMEMNLYNVAKREVKYEDFPDDLHVNPRNSNYFYYEPYQFKLEILKRDTKMSEIDKHIQRAIHGDIINIDELIYTDIIKSKDTYGPTKIEYVRGDLVRNNLNKIFDALKKYPIDDIELTLNLVNKGDWEKLGKLANNKNFVLKVPGYAVPPQFDCILNRDAEKTKEQLKKIYDRRGYNGDGYMLKRNQDESLEDLYKRIKNKIIDDIKFENGMYEKSSKLDEAYFEKLLKKGNYRDILIDLCVRLETVLEGEYKLEGDLSECVDDYFDSYPSRGMEDLIHKLIRCRNNAVHRKTSDEMMDSVELQKCIDYICEMK